MSAVLSQILNRRTLRQMTDSRSFKRGEDYFSGGRVHALIEDGNVVKAKVRGSRDYHIKIRILENEASYSCDCPLGMEEVFCKHLVAVALASLEGMEAVHKSGKSQSVKPAVTMKEVRTYLASQDKEALVDMIVEQVVDDDRLRERLLMKAARHNSKGLDLATYRYAIDHAVDTGGFIDYHSAYDYYRKIDDVVDSVEGLLQDSYAKEVMELTEYFLGFVEERLGEVDDSDGNLGGVLERLQEIHHAACQKAKPDPIALARKLFEWELRTDYDTFYDAVRTYQDVFGKEGVAEYKRLAEAEWSKVPELGPDERDPEHYGRRFRMTHIMEALAEESGDVEALVTIKKRDLSHAYSYLQIAEVYKKAGDYDKALEWAERGVKAFPQKTDSRLRDFLANEYHRKDRHDEAMSLMWAEFEESRSLANYQKLKSHADKIKEWSRWCERALAFIRETIAKAKKRKPKDTRGWKSELDHSLLVEIFLWEKDDEAAWREAKEGGCYHGLWLELAKRREKDHPEDALGVYQKEVEPTINEKHNAAYEQAVQYLRKIRDLLKRLSREDEFNVYLESVRTTHKPKRNLMKLLESFR